MSEESWKFRSTTPRPLGRGRCWCLETCRVDYLVEFNRCWSPNGTGIRMEIRRKIGPFASRLSRSFKVTEYITDRSDTSDFLLLLVIHITTRQSRAVSNTNVDNGDGGKCNFLFVFVLYLTPRWGGYPWNFVTKWGPTRWWNKFDVMRIYLNTVPQRGRQTDRQTETAYQYRRDKKTVWLKGRSKV